MSTAQVDSHQDFSAQLVEGSEYAGFTVVDVIPLAEFSGTAYVMRHGRTGARAVWVACDDENKSFAISFKTPSQNDKGVFHIIEHSVLCGSDRFPVKEPFVNLLKTSMQTFLNALTFADKTMYPVASTNTADLENLMDVYLDAVLHPAIYHRPRIFEQEGWHYELTDEDELVYNGVVFNEMKGATSDPDDVLGLALDRALFPQTAYRFESGGDPRAIPTLTYEEFIDAHARHYDLSNSYVVLYGDMDIERELAFIDQRFAGAESRGAGSPNPLELQEPVRAPYTRVEMATAPENASVALAYVIGTAADRDDVLSCDILLDAIAGSNEAPLKRAVLDAGLGDDFVAVLIDGELQPRVLFQLKGAREGVAEEFRTLVESTCARLAREGIGHDQIAASLAQAEFNLREQDFGAYPTGIAVSVQVMSSWLYDDERPVDYLRYESTLAKMKDGIDKGYFERLLERVVCMSTHCAHVELVPVEEGASAEEQVELAERRATLSDEDCAHIREEVEALRREQEAPDSPEDLAKLPRLAISDIGDSRPEPEVLKTDSPLPCLVHELDTKHIDYLYLYFDLCHVPFEDLPYVGMLSDLLGKLGTNKHDAASLDTLIELNLGSLGFFSETYPKDGDLHEALSLFVMSASALSENVERLVDIPQEVWAHTQFDDTDRIFAILQQRRIVLEQHFVNAGHAAATARLSAQYGAASKISNCLSGVDYYLFLKDLLQNWEDRREGLTAKLESVASAIFGSDNVTASFIGAAQDRERFWECGGTLGLRSHEQLGKVLVAPETSPCNEAFVIPSNVSFVGAGMAVPPTDASAFAAWCVAQRVLSYDYLWNEVRVKGGAYGVGFRHTHSGLRQFWSYRDPGIDATLERYDRTAEWLAAWQTNDEDLSGYVVATVAKHDAPVKPRQLARRQDTLRFVGKDQAWRDEVRKAELSITAEGLRSLAKSIACFAQQRTVCVFAPREAIEASNVVFDEVIDLMA